MDDVHAQARTLLAEQAYAKVAEALRPHLSATPAAARGGNSWPRLCLALLRGRRRKRLLGAW